MRPDLFHRRHILGLLAAVPVVLALPSFVRPALAELTDEEIENVPSDGAWRAGSYVALPARVNVSVELYDDAPEFQKVQAAFAAALRDGGWRRPDGTPLVLSVRIETSRAVEKQRQGGTRGLFLGRMQLFLTDPQTKRRYWDAEAIWRPFESETIRGAEAMVPFVTSKLGQTVELESVMLY